jgi:cytochrome d ubiquinol oxidase subunit II
MQGMLLGAFVRGVEVEGRSFAGGAFDWLNAYSVMTGAAIVFGYALLGATWLVMKTDGITQEWARKCASYVLGYVGLFLGIVSISMPMMNADVRTLWFSLPNLLYLAPVPLITASLFFMIWRDLHRGREIRPFFLSIGVFLMGYIGLGISLWSWLVPFHITFRQAAAAATSQSLLLVGTIVMLPVVLGYTAFCYYLFRGKVSHESAY